jgi:aldose 1-epimerase
VDASINPLRNLIIDTLPVPGETTYTLCNSKGMRVEINSRGATLVSWWAPDRYGQFADVLLGYADSDAYRTNALYFGAIVGRWANRIGNGRFSLDGVDHVVDRNDGVNHLHGGSRGFHLAQWEGRQHGDELILTLTSPDGDAGFPGDLQIEVRYRLDDDGRLSIEYWAVTDAPTPLNLTAHPYFNLSGGGAGVGEHLLEIYADRYLKVDETGIPIDVAAVAGTPFDFRQASAIGSRLVQLDPQIALVGGFDHCYCLASEAEARGTTLRDAAWVYDPHSGRTLSVATTEAGLQFYSGNHLDGVSGRLGRPYARHDGFCLEAHAYPNQINGPGAEKVVLRPGAVYRQTTIYRLTVQETSHN